MISCVLTEFLPKKFVNMVTTWVKVRFQSYYPVIEMTIISTYVHREQDYKIKSYPLNF